MKINKAKLLVGTLAVASVAATVGSISGTVAWFQYSTRVTAAYSGAAAHVSENLQIRLYRLVSPAEGTENEPGYVPAVENKSEWKSDLLIEDVQKFIKAERNNTADYDLRPVTSGNQLKENPIAGTLYTSPAYQKSGDYNATNWGVADKMDFVELPIQLRIRKSDGSGETFLTGKNIYLTDLEISANTTDNTTNQKKDITPALRVSFDATNDVTFSKEGVDVTTCGNLDLNGDGDIDLTQGYEWTQNRTPFRYGSAGSVEKTAKIQQAADEDGMIANDANPKEFVGKELGATSATDGIFNVTVRIYLEGWQELDNYSIINAAEAKDYANLTAMEEAVEASKTLEPTAEGYFAPEDGKTYKLTVDDELKIYKWIAANKQLQIEEHFEEVDYSSPIWSEDSYLKSAFYVGMRFATPVED